MRLCGFLVLLTLTGSTAIGRAAQTQPMAASICSVLERPQFYEGKVLTMKGSIDWQTETLMIYATCPGPEAVGIVLNYAAASVRPKPAFALVRNRAFQEFVHYMRARNDNWKPKRPNGLCIGCNFKYCALVATVVGRFDVVSKEKAMHGDGFGNAGRFRFRLVVESVSDPVAEECRDQ
jgi:hypothetical protein